jgi:hypothetical protein
VLTYHRYEELAELEQQPKTGVYEQKKNNKEYFNQMIIGLILGDGTLVRKYEKGNTYFQYAKSLIHMAYIHHVFNIFGNSNYCNITKLDVKEIIVKGNMYKNLSFSTKSLQEFNRLHSLFYINRKKIVPI